MAAAVDSAHTAGHKVLAIPLSGENSVHREGGDNDDERAVHSHRRTGSILLASVKA